MLKNNENQILNIIKYSPLIIIILTSILVTFLIYTDYSKSLEEQRELIKKNYIKEQKLLVKQYVKTAISFINRKYENTEISLKNELEVHLNNALTISNSIYKNNKDRKTKDEIITQIKETLRDIRFYEGRGYFFITTKKGISILHPILPKREGIDISKKEDKNGINRFKKIQKIIDVKEKGFVTFHFYYPHDKTKQNKKIVYIKSFKPYNLVFGTGEYLKDFEKKVKNVVLNHLGKIKLGKQKFYGVFDESGKILSHGNKKYVNTNIKKDIKLETIVSMLKRKQNYFRIEDLNPNTNSISKKIIYIEKSPKWNWYVSASFFLDDINETIEEEQKVIENRYKQYLNTIIIISILITIVLIFLSFYIAKILEDKFISYKNRLENIINENIIQNKILEKAQEVAKIGEWELNLETNKAYWSPHILKIFGINKEPKNAGPEFLQSIMHKDDWKGFEESINKAIQENTEHKYIYRIYKPNGNIRWIDCRGHFDNKRNIISGIVQDITENKELEYQKLEQEELIYQQSKMAAMGEMLGNIAHQWRQPLTTISVLATGSKFEKQFGKLSDEKFLDAMNNINKNAQFLSQTIDDFRNFYKPNKAKTNFAIKNTIEKTLDLFKAQFIQKDIYIIKEIEDYLLFSLENELVQVLINLINNARDALSLQKKDYRNYIFIKSFKNNNNNNNIHISIQDNAGGINSKIINRIFEPYFTTKHQNQGTGIGLYMSNEIVKKHLQGEILAQNINFIYEDKEYTGAKFEIIIKKELS